MKANELMIGDLVHYCCVPIQIEQVLPTTGGADMNPIPLTEEILKANGILGKCRQSINGVTLCTGMSIENGMYLFEYKFGGSLVLSIAVVYVHELQHALRLVGLNELADNFKIV